MAFLTIPTLLWILVPLAVIFLIACLVKRLSLFFIKVGAIGLLALVVIHLIR